jgi:dTDP-4-dehydrorhamnose reductase
MKILLLGANGQVGGAFQELSKTDAFPIGWTLHAWDRVQGDLSKPADLIAAIEHAHTQTPIDVVINAAAYTQVDLAEKETEICDAINAVAPGALAAFCKSKNLPLVHFSSDYVYSGQGVEPHHETEGYQPLGRYGASKAIGDEAVVASGCDHLIFRTSWVYSHEGKNFVKTMLRLGAERSELRVVSDQVGSPTYAPDLAKYALDSLMQAMIKKVETGAFPSGIYHLTNSGYTSWADFAVAIFASMRAQGGAQAAALKVDRVVPIASSDFPTPAKRPLNSRLSLQKFSNTFGITPRPWAEALKECLQKLGTQNHG